MCRIHNCTPPQAVKYLRSPQQKLMFFSELKLRYLDSSVNVLDYKIRTFKPYDLVWRKVDKRHRAKSDDGFTGPHKVLKRVGEVTYRINSHLGQKRTHKVNINDLNQMKIPDTSSWTLNKQVLIEVKDELEIPGSIDNMEVFLDFLYLSPFILDNLSDDSPSVFIIPEWPCCSWYAPLHQKIRANAIQLPDDQEDLFLDSAGKPLGLFAWKHWIFFKP